MGKGSVVCYGERVSSVLWEKDQLKIMVKRSVEHYGKRVSNVSWEKSQ